MTILFVGTVPPPYHGQAVAFETAYKHMRGVKYLVNQNFETKSGLVKTFLLLLSFFKIWYYLIFKQIDVVYFTCSRSTIGSIKDVVLVYSAKLFGLPIVNHLHGVRMYEFIDMLPKYYRKIIFDMYSRLDVSIVLLESMKSEFHQFWPNMNVKVVPNFYTDEFTEVTGKRSGNMIKLVYLSNIIYSKGILDTLDAFSFLKAGYSNVELIIAGDFIGDEYYTCEEIQKMFYEKLTGMNGVHFIGVVSGKEKVELLSQTDIFVLPTFYSMEAFPLSIIEAMRSGNVIVTSKHNYLPKIINHEIGYLVDPSSPKQLALCLESIVRDPKQMVAIQNYNQNYAKTHYTQKQYIERLDLIMKETLQS